MHPDVRHSLVKNPRRERALHSRLLGREPVEHHPNPAMFKLNGATTLGLPELGCA